MGADTSPGNLLPDLVSTGDVGRMYYHQVGISHMCYGVILGLRRERGTR